MSIFKAVEAHYISIIREHWQHRHKYPESRYLVRHAIVYLRGWRKSYG